MAHVHSRRVVHRDLKPANVFLDANGFPRVGDLGWAKLCQPRESDSAVRASALYMAPELFEVGAGSDLSVDVYSFGIFLWELITARSYEEYIREIGIKSYTAFQEHVLNGGRPPLEDLSPGHRRLLERCWSATERFTFQEIAGELRKPENVFEGADSDRFAEYADSLELFEEADADRQIEKLLRRGTQLRRILAWLADLRRAAPLTERIARAFGVLAMRDGGLNLEVIRVIRYVLATRGVLHCQLVRSLMSRSPRGKFPLGLYIVDVTEVVNMQVDRVDITSSRDELFKCLKNVLSLICGVHPCVLEFKGWNIECRDGRLDFVTVTSKCNSVRQEEIGRWDNDKRERFVIGIAVGISHLHSLGIFHDSFNLSSVRVDRVTSRPRICGFGLSEPDAEFGYEVDSLACHTVFIKILPDHHPWREHCDHLKLISKDRISLQEFIDECLREETTKDEICDYKAELERENNDQNIRGRMGSDEILFDLLRALCDSHDKWTMKGGEVDIAKALFELIPDRDPASEVDFRTRVVSSFAQYGTLRRALFADF
jgi:serine/threonine protein kinase